MSDIAMTDAGSSSEEKELCLVRWSNALEPVKRKGKEAAVPLPELVVKAPRWVYNYAQRLDAEMRNFQENFATLFPDVAKLKAEFPQLVSAYEELLRQQHLLFDTVSHDNQVVARLQQDQFSEIVAA